MTLYPYWLITAGRKLQAASSWVDAHLFPLPADDKQQMEESRKIEAASAFIKKQIKHCKTTKQATTIRLMILNFKRLYGNTTQVKSWADSLSLKLYNKENQILNNL